MECPLCGHAKAHKYGKMPNGHQRYLCPACHQTFAESFDSLYYRRHISPEQIRQVLQAHSEGNSLRGISRTTKLAYNTVVSIVRAASQKAQLVHNQALQVVQTEADSADALWSCVSKTKAMHHSSTRTGRLWDWFESCEY